MSEEYPSKKLSELTPEEKSDILRHFREAVRSRARQWDHEDAIERILGRDVDDFCMEDFAAGVGDPDDTDMESLITWDDISTILAD